MQQDLGWRLWLYSWFARKGNWSVQGFDYGSSCTVSKVKKECLRTAIEAEEMK
jgi:hypothetical protein